MSWQPIVHRWASRIALLGFGIVAGGLTDEVASGRAHEVIWIITIPLAITAWLTIPDDDSQPNQTRLRRWLNSREAATEGETIIRLARETAKDVRRGAERDAEGVRSAARQEAREIVDKARTSAAALDPAAEHQPRVGPTERSTELS